MLRLRNSPKVTNEARFGYMVDYFARVVDSACRESDGEVPVWRFCQFSQLRQLSDLDAGARE